MIVKIRSVQDFRAFNGWRWPSALPQFQQINLIYGVNGTGKSTLASMLQDAHRDASWSSGLHLDVLGHDGKSRSVNTPSDAVWQDMRVFNKEYVSTNLRFDEEAGSAAVSLLVLGKQRVEAENERTRLQQRLVEVAEALPNERKQAKQTKTQSDAIATDRARLIAQELGSLGGRYEPRSYTAAKVRQLIGTGVEEAGAATSAMGDALLLVKSSSKTSVAVPSTTRFSLGPLLERTKQVLSESAVANVLSDLEDGHRGRWAQEGLELHQDRDSCIFCGNTIDAARRQALESHFDTSLVTLQNKLGSLTDDLAVARKTASDALDALPRTDDLFEVHRSDYEAALKIVYAKLQGFQEVADQLTMVVGKKREALFKPISAQLPTDDYEISLSSIESVLAAHNATATDFKTKQGAAAKLIETTRVAEVADDYRKLVEEGELHQTRIVALEAEETQLRKEIAALNESDLDAEPIAARLNDDLAHLLGRSDLTFAVAGQGYTISRSGTPARHLSEGERNAISLLYFLRSLETHETQAASSIVVIDDPVSSLDGSMLVGASTHLWTQLVGANKCRQLFLLTHNFELFRLWAAHLEHYPKARDLGITYGVYEMRTGARQLADGSHRRVPLMLAWPDDPKVQARLRSEYHYMFWRVISALRDCVEQPSAEADIEAATVLPNVCRRLLEGFLGFKYPSLLGNLHAQIMRASDSSISEAMRARVLRFAHAYSHNQEADTTLPVARPEAVEMLHVVLEFMRVIDHEHFDAMCDAVGVDSGFLGQLHVIAGNS
jgi:wobble nucleotide-excising tRNase